MQGHKMNRYRGGSSSVASRVGLAHILAQLKAENPVPLRTICDFDLLPVSRGLTTSMATIIFAEALIKLD
jgi:hypothetical protein